MTPNFRQATPDAALRFLTATAVNRRFLVRIWREELASSQLSRKCNARCGKYRQLPSKRRGKKEKADCTELPQLAESVRLATPLARFGKIGRTASKQGVASASLAGRATAFDLIESE